MYVRVCIQHAVVFLKLAANAKHKYKSNMLQISYTQ